MSTFFHIKSQFSICVTMCLFISSGPHCGWYNYTINVVQARNRKCTHVSVAVVMPSFVGLSPDGEWARERKRERQREREREREREKERMKPDDLFVPRTCSRSLLRFIGGSGPPRSNSGRFRSQRTEDFLVKLYI